tara:strand:- start:14572 stop:14940 length:369 start_codon:yes stop_codon:yes gene_type:complete
MNRINNVIKGLKKLKQVQTKEEASKITTGTFKLGYVCNVTYNDLVEMFGEPILGQSMDQKVNYEWVLKQGDNVFTIYDWKRDKSYSKNIAEIWNVGGKKLTIAFEDGLMAKSKKAVFKEFVL